MRFSKIILNFELEILNKRVKLKLTSRKGDKW